MAIKCVLQNQFKQKSLEELDGILPVESGGTGVNAIPFGICETEAGVAEKVVTVGDGTTNAFQLTTGARLFVRFNTIGSTTNTIRLNVNGTGAKQVYAGKNDISYNHATEASFKTGRTYEFIYDGTGWNIAHAIIRMDDAYGYLGVSKGGTGATTAEAARNNLGAAAKTDLPSVVNATIGTSWTENTSTGVKTQTVSISGVTAADNAKVDVRYTGDGTSAGYATFVEQQNQFLERVTNGFAETVAGGIKFTIFGDATTVSIPIFVEVI